MARNCCRKAASCCWLSWKPGGDEVSLLFVNPSMGDPPMDPPSPDFTQVGVASTMPLASHAAPPPSPPAPSPAPPFPRFKTFASTLLGSSVPFAAYSRSPRSVVAPVASTHRKTAACVLRPRLPSRGVLLRAHPRRSAAALSSSATRILRPMSITYPAATSARAVAVASSNPAMTHPPGEAPTVSSLPLVDAISAAALRHMRRASFLVTALAKNRSPRTAVSAPPSAPPSAPTSPAACPANSSHPPGNAGTTDETSHRSGQNPGVDDAAT